MIGFVHASGWDLAQIWLIDAYAVIAAISATQLAVTGPRKLRPACWAIAALAAFYSVAYFLLIVGPWSQADWTRAIRWPGNLVWLLLWIWLPRRCVRYAREIGARAAMRKVQVAVMLALANPNDV